MGPSAPKIIMFPVYNSHIKLWYYSTNIDLLLYTFYTNVIHYDVNIFFRYFCQWILEFIIKFVLFNHKNEISIIESIISDNYDLHN